MIKIISSVCFLLMLSVGLCGQNLSSKVAAIKSDASYKWGEGTGKTLEEADKEALRQLISHISVSVTSSYVQENHQLTTAEGERGKEDIELRLSSYSFATLQNVGQIILSEENPARVFRYVTDEEVQKSFSARRERALAFIAEADWALEKVQVGDALKYYYWALALLHSVPDGENMKIQAGGREVLASAWLTERMQKIFDRLVFKVSKIDGKENYSVILFDIYYKDVPVVNLDFQYWMGQRYSPVVTAKDGRGMAEVPELDEEDQIKIRIEYQYATMASNLDAELRGCFAIQPPAFPLRCIQKMVSLHPEAEALVTGNPAGEQQGMRVSAYVRGQDKYESVVYPEPEDMRYYGNVMMQIEQAINSGDYESVRQLFSSDGYEMFTGIIAYGNAYIVSKPAWNFIQSEEGVICQGLPMQFRFRGNRMFLEDMTFRFDSNGKICSLAFMLNKSVRDLISDSGFRWENTSRLMMMEFLEDYQTAYALKRIDYLERIFSDDALIIVGNVLKIVKNTDDNRVVLKDDAVEFKKYTKREYITNLRRSFASKEFINIGFEDVDICKMTRGGEIYAIHIKQYYYSNNYSDTGYLTLLVDMRDKVNPMIHIRVWSPEKDPDFTARKFLQHGASLLN